jgi:class 3 adenylate cyclase
VGKGSTVSLVAAELPIDYAKTRDGFHIAYAVLGEGPTNVVYLGGPPTHLQLDYEEALIRRYIDRLATFGRLVLFDERGTGMSDPVALSDLPTLETRMDDLGVVMDAAHVEFGNIVASGAGCPLAMLFAATYPQRVTSLTLYAAYAALVGDDEYRIGFPPALLEEFATGVGSTWGTGSMLELAAPSIDTSAFRERWAHYERSASSPGQAEAIFRRNFASDVRPVLPAITAPTLVLHRRDNLMIPITLGRYVADHIEGARFVELEGHDLYPFAGDSDAVIAEIEEFVTGQRSTPDIDRVLATVLFTDIVDSTMRAAALGDRLWRELLDEHDAMIHRHLDRFRGRAVKSTGDGFLATFDGPARAMRCACAIRDSARSLGLEIRAGLHTGEIEIRSDDIAGIAVHTAARVESMAQPGEVLVSSAIPPLVAGSGLHFVNKGEHSLKGVPGSWTLFAVEE